MILLRFIADRSFVSRAIRFRTDGQPSHVEYFNTITGMTYGARMDGVKARPLNYCHPTWQEFYTFEGIEYSYLQALTFIGRKYDTWDIFSLAVGSHPAKYNPEKAICSVCVGYSNRRAWSLGKISRPLINPNVPTWEITPMLLYGAVTFQAEVPL